jgi:hypothetical protein
LTIIEFAAGASTSAFAFEIIALAGETASETSTTAAPTAEDAFISGSHRLERPVDRSDALFFEGLTLRLLLDCGITHTPKNGSITIS